MSADAGALIVWMVTDGKAGHLNQLRGLAHALGERTPALPHRVDAPGAWRALSGWALGRFRAGEELPTPHLILCAGRRTHLAALAARRARGGRIVVLMRPSLQGRWFDLCLAPRHDLGGRRASERVIPTLGALCDVRPTTGHDPACGVFLIGGPSKRHGWDEAGLGAQVRAIVEGMPGVRWRLTTSRRTPDSTTALLRSLACERLEVIPVEETAPGWVREALERAGFAWATEDSVSMLYEALTSGCAVGTLGVPRVQEDRVTRGVDALAEEGLVTTFEAWRERGAMPAPGRVVDEAARCAEIILERWFADRAAGA